MKLRINIVECIFMDDMQYGFTIGMADKQTGLLELC